MLKFGEYSLQIPFLSVTSVCFSFLNEGRFYYKLCEETISKSPQHSHRGARDLGTISGAG